MAPAVVERWRSVAPADIDTSLPDLWREAARERPVSRALMSNLVVVSRSSGSSGHIERLGPESDIVGIAERHPARIILLNYSPISGRPCAPSEASVGVLTFGAGAVQYGVEVIAVHAACAEASVPSIVRRLTRGDVPTTLWWTGDLSRSRPPNAMVETARQLLYDSAGWQDIVEGARVVTALLDLPHAPDLADLNWQRLAPLRGAIVHALRHEKRATSVLPSGVTIRHSPRGRAAAALVGAWLKRGIRWTGSPTIEESGDDDDLVGLRLSGQGWELGASSNSERVLVSFGPEQPPFTVPVPRLTVTDAVVAELRSLGRDRHLRETMTTLAAPTP